MDRDIDFHGAKLALFLDEHILVYRRDDKPDIPFPNMLDLPGGGRENGESGAECAARETKEEFGIEVAPASLTLVEQYANWRGTGSPALFYVGIIIEDQVDNIVFGDEGQSWKMMPVDQYLQSEEAIPHLKEQLLRHIQR